MRRLIELSRYVVAVPAIGTIIGSFVLMILGVWEIGVSIVNLINHSVTVKQSVVGILTAVDTLPLATGRRRSGARTSRLHLRHTQALVRA